MEATGRKAEEGPPEALAARLRGFKPQGYVHHGGVGVEWDGVKWWALFWRRSRLSLVGIAPAADGPEYLAAVVGEPLRYWASGEPEARKGPNLLDQREWEGYEPPPPAPLVPRLAPVEVVAALLYGMGLTGHLANIFVGAGVVPEGDEWPPLRFQVNAAPPPPQGLS